MSKLKCNKINALFFFVLVMMSQMALAERVKDLTNVAGVRSNHLIGYGLVVGLNGTGDKTDFSDQSLKSMLNKFGINLPSGSKTNSKNIAAVAVHADLPPFAKPGQKLDITASSLGNAKSLRGGTLLLTPLKGVDNNVYALAQGNLLVGALDSSKGDRNNIHINTPSVGRIPDGAMVERSIKSGFDLGNTITLNLKDPDFTTVTNLVNAVNEKLGEGTASAIDGDSIEVLAPRLPNQRVAFLSLIENIEVVPGEAIAKIIVNSRTGTVVIGKSVRLKPAAITHAGMIVKITEDQSKGDENPFELHKNKPQADAKMTIEVGKGTMFKIKSASLDDLVQAVNKVGATPSDLVAILEALKKVGSLKAELMVI